MKDRQCPTNQPTPSPVQLKFQVEIDVCYITTYLQYKNLNMCLCSLQCVEVLDEVVKEEVASSKKRGQKKGLGHVRPDVTMLDRERTLLRIATRGGVWVQS